MLETVVTGVLSSSRLRVIPRDHLRHPQSPLSNLRPSLFLLSLLFFLFSLNLPLVA